MTKDDTFIYYIRTSNGTNESLHSFASEESFEKLANLLGLGDPINVFWKQITALDAFKWLMVDRSRFCWKHTEEFRYE